MNRTKLIIRLFITALVALVAGSLLTGMAQMAHPELPTGVVLPLLGTALLLGALSHAPGSPGVTRAIGGIDVEFWTTVLMDVLFPKNSFMHRTVHSWRT